MPPDTAVRPIAMRARAALVVQRGAASRDGSRIAVLHSHAPLVLRPTHPKGPEPLIRRAAGVARVALAAGAAGPLGGDDYAFDVHVQAGSTLVLNEVSAMLLLPGAHGGRSRMRIRIRVDDDATLVWLPELVIAASGCDHLHEIDVALAGRARFLMRDEVLLGRHREGPGSFEQHVRVHRSGRPLYIQRLKVGGAGAVWRSPVVTGGRKCVGNVLVVDPGWADDPPSARQLDGTGVVTPLAGPAMLIAAVADDTRTMRRLLDDGVESLGAPWHVRDAPADESRVRTASDSIRETEKMGASQ